jgi:methionine-rich copper-binding protein CopC
MTVPRRVLPLLPVLALLPARAGAHALVTGSEPASGGRVAAGAREAVVRFNSRIDQSRSQLLLAPLREGGGGTADESRLELIAAPDTELRARLPALPPGRWRLRWQVLALDGHITRGDIPFTVEAR